MKRLILFFALCVLVATTTVAQQMNIEPKKSHVLATSSQIFQAADIEAADRYTALIPTVVEGIPAKMIVFELLCAGMVGGDGGSEIDTRAYGYYGSGYTASSALHRTTMSVHDGITVTSAGHTFAIAANAAGSSPFYICSGSANSFLLEPVFPYVALRLDKEGTGTFSAGTVTVNWTIYR
jgi:hypothetical protein